MSHLCVAGLVFPAFPPYSSSASSPSLYLHFHFSPSPTPIQSSPRSRLNPPLTIITTTTTAMMRPPPTPQSPSASEVGRPLSSLYRLGSTTSSRMSSKPPSRPPTALTARPPTHPSSNQFLAPPKRHGSVVSRSHSARPQTAYSSRQSATSARPSTTGSIVGDGGEYIVAALQNKGELFWLGTTLIVQAPASKLVLRQSTSTLDGWVTGRYATDNGLDDHHSGM